MDESQIAKEVVYVFRHRFTEANAEHVRTMCDFSSKQAVRKTWLELNPDYKEGQQPYPPFSSSDVELARNRAVTAARAKDDAQALLDFVVNKFMPESNTECTKLK